MKDGTALTIASLLSIVFFTFHWADDMVRGFAPGGFSALFGVAILVVWLCGTVALAGRLSGYIIMLLGGALGVAALLLHMRGAGLVGGRIAGSSGIFFWVWTLIMLAGSSSLAGILSIRAMWRLRSGRPQ